MLNLHTALKTALPAAGESFAVATIVGTRGSAPHPAGTSMLIHEDGSITGSISGGCIDAAVHAAALGALADREPRRERYGYSTADALVAGLTCGGEIEVHIAPFRPHSPMHRMLDSYASLERTDPVVVVRRIDAAASDSANAPALLTNPARLSLPELAGLLAPLLGSADSSLAATLCFPLVGSGRTGTIRAEQTGGSCNSAAFELLVESRLAPPRMIIFGANTFAEELLKLAPMLGYASTLCDARATFTVQPRFAIADEISTSWPHAYLAAELAAGRIDERTVICVLTHDPKFDIPLLKLALGLARDRQVAYVGAMGSRSSHASRRRDLLAADVPGAALAALRSPIGLDLQACSPGEVAIGIAAEIIASRSAHASGAPLRSLSGPIHQPGPQHTYNREVPAWT